MKKTNLNKVISAMSLFIKIDRKPKELAKKNAQARSVTLGFSQPSHTYNLNSNICALVSGGVTPYKRPRATAINPNSFTPIIFIDDPQG
ncbi:hypothetical protein [Pseudoalteromonas sp. MMG012]|uniref:hypothetical protein n=1 Tax=Pseudoalteromonas sp. MMG012 TaxID=2822686 RepID=UPI001B3A61D0|nr:hypothetical protein [Pseudoalteromonas sp. MMG012]MBQ4850560.1 hypothetical protein [Pseudoalteromonas sp. MMG012]